MKLFHPIHLTPNSIRSLAIDLASIREGSYPAPNRLGSGLPIEEWEIDYFWAPILRGKTGALEGHELGEDISSYIWAADENAGWARTTTEFYRLGTPKTFRRGRAGRAFRDLLIPSGDGESDKC